MTRVPWDQHFMRRAHDNAGQSTCLTRHVGVVATRGNRAFADGFNGNLPGETHCDEGGCPRCNHPSREPGVDLGRCWCVHAEQNLVAWCAMTGTPLGGATLYCTTKPCLDCLKLVISSGVDEVVYFEDYPESSWLPRLNRPFILRQIETEP